MPVSVNFDIHGVIQSVVVCPEGSGVVHAQPRLGERTIIVEASELQLDARGRPTLEEIKNLTKNFRVDINSLNGKLIKQNGPQANRKLAAQDDSPRTSPARRNVKQKTRKQ
jgi:hypothetical protein